MTEKALPPFRQEHATRYNALGDATRRRFNGGAMLRGVLNTDPGLGCVLMLAGEPGSGKSTLALACALTSGLRTLVIGSEEDPRDIGARAKRIAREGPPADLFIAKEREVGQGFTVRQAADIVTTTPRYPIIVIDSINELHSQSGDPIPSATKALVEAARKSGSFLILICHVNKDGDIFGPKRAEHLVDATAEIRIDLEYEVRTVVVRKSRLGPAGQSISYRLTEKGVELCPTPGKQKKSSKK